MIKTLFHSPSGKILTNASLEYMKECIVDNFYSYWNEGSGDGFIELYINDIKTSTMMIGPNPECGIYLHIVEEKNNKEWISVFNRDYLNEVVETADGIYASIGLFLPIELAWEGIKSFMTDGSMTDKIVWNDPEIIPEDGNW